MCFNDIRDILYPKFLIDDELSIGKYLADDLMSEKLD